MNNDKIVKINNQRTSFVPNVNQLNSNITQDFVKKPFVTPKVVRSVNNRNNLIIDDKKKNLENNFAMNLMNGVTSFLKNDKNWYLNFGGTGDLILLLACCYDDVDAQIVFCANTGSMDLCKEFLEHFKKDYYLSRNVMGTITANTLHDYMRARPNFKPSAHLAKGLYFGDWPINIDYYEKNMRLKTNWIDEIGKNKFFLNDKVIIIQPSGSVRSLDRQRYLSPAEYYTLVKKYLSDNYTVITTGSMGDKEFYNWKPSAPKNYFMTSNQIFGYNHVNSITLNSFLQTVNTADKIISVDTWLKTYAALAGINTFVIQSRCKGNYLNVGSDVGDIIFLNSKWWPNLQVVPFHEAIKIS